MRILHYKRNLHYDLVQRRFNIPQHFALRGSDTLNIIFEPRRRLIVSKAIGQLASSPRGLLIIETYSEFAILL